MCRWFDSDGRHQNNVKYNRWLSKKCLAAYFSKETSVSKKSPQIDEGHNAGAGNHKAGSGAIFIRVCTGSFELNGMFNSPAAPGRF